MHHLAFDANEDTSWNSAHAFEADVQTVRGMGDDASAVADSKKPASPRSVVSSSAGSCIFADKDVPSAPTSSGQQKPNPSSSSSPSFLPPLLSRLSLSSDSFNDDDQCGERNAYDRKSSTSSQNSGDSGMLRSILKSSLYNACASGNLSCSSSGASTGTMRKNVSFSEKLNEVKSISAIDQRILSKGSAGASPPSTPDGRAIRDAPTSSNSPQDLSSSLTCVSNLTCNSFRYYSNAVEDNSIPLMSVFNIDDDDEDWDA